MMCTCKLHMPPNATATAAAAAVPSCCPPPLHSPQVFSRVVSHGLEGRKLRATYKEADQLEYQDSLGQLLLAVASMVPDGMLLFLPSYALMEKLSKRWQVGAVTW